MLLKKKKRELMGATGTTGGKGSERLVGDTSEERRVGVVGDRREVEETRKRLTGWWL